MRWPWVAVLLVLPALGGCLELFDGKDRGGDGEVAPADVGFDPATIRVTGVERATYTVPSFDETSLAAVVYAPLSPDTLPDGSPPAWGVVVFVHGWGTAKEVFEGSDATGVPVPDQAGAAASQAPYTANHLEEFAAQGLIAVAYDARGFGGSTGTTTVAGPAEMADLDAVLSFVEARYATNGLVGVTGVSYGGGHSFQAWADNPRVTTAAPIYGWVDLYEGLFQGNVPKAQWAAALSAGVATAKGQASPMLADWYRAALTREGLDTVQAQMDLRSVLPRMGSVAKPLFVCQGLQETLLPQADLAWGGAGGFTRAMVYTGGHGTEARPCWPRILDWMLYFVGGRDTGVDAWPALSSVDASGSEALLYGGFPEPAWRTYYLRAPTLASDPSPVTFTVEQRLLANPFQEPSFAWDGTGMPFNQVPEQLRQDPSAVFFETPTLTGSEVLMGAPVIRLRLADAATPTPYQVAGVLFHVDAAGKSRVLSHSAAAALDAGDAPGGTLEMRFWWTKADLQPGDRLVLKLGANDPSVWLQLPADYSVAFTGGSELLLPFFEG